MLDLRYALRIARRNPGSTTAAFVALTLGIGATTAIFSAVDSVILRPLPVKNDSAVVRIYESDARSDRDFVSMADFLDWKRQLNSFANLAVFRMDQGNVTGKSGAERVRIFQCDAGLLRLLGVNPILGRAFSDHDDQPGSEDVTLLSWGFWQTHFGGENVLGRKLFLDEVPFTVIGVLPRSLWVFGDRDLWLPLSLDPKLAVNKRGRRWYWALGRLKSGISLAAANAELTAEASSLAAEFPQQNTGVGAVAVPLRTAVAGNARPALLLLFAAGLCVLLIACGNVANLALARASSRRREISLRTALGATRLRLFRQLLTENTVISFAAALAGLGLAAVCIRLLKHLSGTRIPHPEELSIDWRVSLFAIGVGIISGVVFGLAPAMTASATRVHDALKESSGRLTESKTQQRLRQFFIALESAVAALLLIQSALLIRSYANAARIDPGLDAAHVLTVETSLVRARYGPQAPGSVDRFVNKLLPNLRAIAGIEQAALTSSLPIAGTAGGGPVLVQGGATNSDSAALPFVQWTRISPDYFQTMGIRRIAGRDFNDRDNRRGPPVVIVNQTFARELLHNEHPLGQKVAVAVTGTPPQWREIVGLVADVPQLALEKKPVPEIFFPLAQFEYPWLSIIVRTAGDPLRYTAAIRAQIRDIDPAVACFEPRTMQQIISSQLGWRVFESSLVGIFAAIAIVLACIGIYAVIAWSVTQRTAEIGVRLALGASRGNILRIVIGHAAVPAFAGTVVGALCSLAASRLLAQLLYGVEPTDALTYIAVLALFFAVALLASYLPARRALRLDPGQALRYE